MLSRLFSEPYKITINRYTLYRDVFMNSRFSRKRVLLYSGLLAFAMSSAYAASPDVTPLVFANDYVSAGAGAKVIGDIKANNYVTTGANSSVIGLIETGAAVTLGANANVGDVSDDAAVIFGANAYLSGTAFYTEPSKFRYQEVVRAQSEFKAMGKEEKVIPLAPTITTSRDLDPGFYSAASLATTAGITIQLNAHDQPGNWIFNITDILSFGANTKIELINPDPEGTNRIIWNSGGYTAVGAGAQIKGTILAHTYVSTGAGSTLTGVDSCGGIFSATSYVSIGADSVVGSKDCVTKTLVAFTSAPNSETVAVPPGMSLPNENLIKNPSFEEGSLCAKVGHKSWCIVGQNEVPSWEATQGQIELDVTVWPAFEGRVSVDLSPNKNSFLHQTVELVIGQDYVLTFALSSNTCGNGKGYYKIGTDSDREVKFTGIKKWQTIKAKFTATEVMTQIGFGSLSGSSCGPVIDDIKLLRDDTNIL
jgi:hypothetical protein